MSIRSEVVRIFNELLTTAKKISSLPAAGAITGDELIEVVQDGENVKTTISAVASGGEGVLSVVAGDNITIDDTDPQNPIISSTGGGGSAAEDITVTPAGGIAATDVQAALQELDTEKAPIASPTLTGTPAAPTAAQGTNTTQLATTAYVQTEVALKMDKSVTANRQASSYTLVLGDAGKLVELNNASANNLTVPLNSSVAFPTGTQILIAQYGAGQTTVVATGGVTIRSSGGKLKLSGQYSGGTLVKIATDEWYLFGDITT